jgi:hypothetical protein
MVRGLDHLGRTFGIELQAVGLHLKRASRSLFGWHSEGVLSSS